MSEPDPQPGVEDVSPFVLPAFAMFLNLQVQKGFETYGTRLQTANNRSAFNDGMEEAVDLIQYFVQLQMQYQYLLAYVRSEQEDGDLHNNQEFKEVIKKLLSVKDDMSAAGYDKLTEMFTT